MEYKLVKVKQFLLYAVKHKKIYKPMSHETISFPISPPSDDVPDPRDMLGPEIPLWTSLEGIGGIAMIDGSVEEQRLLATDGECDREDIEYISFSTLETIYVANRDLETEQSKCEKLTFRRAGEEIKDFIGYNPSQPIYDVRYADSGKPYFILRVRMEKREDERYSRVVPFRADSPFSTVWDLIENDGSELPEITGQDPSVTIINEQLFVSIVKVVPKPAPEGSELDSDLDWWQEFSTGPDINHLTYFSSGPLGMKNVTPVQMPTGEIVTFTRPQKIGNETLGGHGQIGEITTGSIEAIRDPNILQNAPIINTQFEPGVEWGAIKGGKPLTDGRIGVFGHISRYDTQNPRYKNSDRKPKIYSTIVGKYNRKTRKIEEIKIVAMADEFVGVVAKSEYEEDVTYTTVMTDPDENGDVIIMQGVGDSETWIKRIPDPFAGLRLPPAEPNLALAA